MIEKETLIKLRDLLELFVNNKKSKQLKPHPDGKRDIENAQAGGPTGPSKIADREYERGKNVATPAIV